jgi:hypothetical protein
MAHTNDRAGLAKPLTLAVDIGGSHLKAAVLNASGKMSADPVRIKTPKPDAIVAARGAGRFRFDGAESRYQRVAWFQAWCSPSRSFRQACPHP